MYSSHIDDESEGGKMDINIQSKGNKLISWFPWFMMVSRDFKWFQSDEINLFPLDNDKVDGVETSRIFKRIDQQDLSIGYYTFSNNLNILNMYIAK
jgi:hypothetical protein